MKKKLFLAILIFTFLIPLSIKAGGLVPCGGPGEKPCTLCDLFVMFQRYVNGLLFIVIPPMAILMIAIGGFMLVLAHTSPGGGAPETIKKAKTLFKTVIIGLILIYGAWIFVNTFLQFIGINKSNVFKDLPKATVKQQLQVYTLSPPYIKTDTTLRTIQQPELKLITPSITALQPKQVPKVIPFTKQAPIVQPIQIPKARVFS